MSKFTQSKLWTWRQDMNSSALLASHSLLCVTLCLNGRKDVFSTVPGSLSPQPCRPAGAHSDSPRPAHALSLGLTRSQGASPNQELRSTPGLRVQLDLQCSKLHFLTWDFNTCHLRFLSEIKCFSQCLLLSFYFKHVHNWPNQAMTILAIFSLFRAFLASRLSLVQLIVTHTWSHSQLRLAWKSAVGADWVLATASSNLGGTRCNGVYQNLLPEW